MSGSGDRSEASGPDPSPAGGEGGAGVHGARGRERAGERMRALARDLFPLNRSLTGDGVRETLERLREVVPLDVHEIESGTRVLDWTVPPEWNVREAWIHGPGGETIADLRDSNLHLVGYSVPVHERMPLERLRPHLHSLPEQPDRIPYRTSYWERTWGFCLRHRDLERLPEGDYEVLIDATLDEGGHLTWGELRLEGERDEEVLISCHVCHPSMASDNLSGVLTGAFLGRALGARPRRLSYRVVFAPGTIGALVWLDRNRSRLHRVRHGVVLTCLGGDGRFTYKRSRRGDAAVDRAAAHLLAHRRPPGEVRPFVPMGYDERQYGSPGFDLPVGRLTRTPNGEFPEYHTSADDLSLLDADGLDEGLDLLLDLCTVLERDRVPVNLQPWGEPQLGRRGLYRRLGGEPELDGATEAMLWVLNQADGTRSLLEIAERSGLPFSLVERTAAVLEGEGLLRGETTR